MGERKNPFRNIQVEVRSSPRLLKIVVILLIVFSMAALGALAWIRSGIQEQTAAVQSEAAALEQENADLQDKIDSLGSVQSVQDIAQEELGLADPNTIIIDPTN